MRRGQPRQSTSTSATRTLLVSFFFSSRRRHTRSCLVSWARDVYKRQGGDRRLCEIDRGEAAGDFRRRAGFDIGRLAAGVAGRSKMNLTLSSPNQGGGFRAAKTPSPSVV